MTTENTYSTMGLVGLGVAASYSARYFRRKLMLRPFQLSVIVAVPAFGVAVMQTVIDYSTPRTVQSLQAAGPDADEASQAARLATQNLTQRLRMIAEPSRK